MERNWKLGEISQITKIANELGWSVKHYPESNQFSFQRFSGEGQDFWLEDVDGEDLYELVTTYGDDTTILTYPKKLICGLTVQVTEQTAHLMICVMSITIWKNVKRKS